MNEKEKAIYLVYQVIGKRLQKCAEEVQMNSPGRKALLNAYMNRMPKEHRSRWCEAGWCGCMGCANRCGGLEKAGFYRAEWEAWNKF